MAKLSPIAALKEGDLQIPEGPLSGAMLREALRRLFAELNPYFDGINKLAAKGITAGDNFTADIVTGSFTHAVAQQVALKTLKRADYGVILSAAGKVAISPAVVEMVQPPPTLKQTPACNVTITFTDAAATNIACTILLLSR